MTVALPTLPTFPSIDFSALQMPTFDLPTFDLPKFDLPNFELPKVELPKVDAERVANAAKDVAFITVGLAVTAFQQAQVRRRELTRSVTDQLSTGRAQLDEVVDSIEARLAPIVTRLQS